MAYAQIYNLEFINQQGQTCSLELWNDTDLPPIEISYLTGSDRPVVLKSIDNDRKISTPIRGQELTAEIVTDVLTIDTFISDNDLAWKGVFKVNGDTVFSGFLVQEDSTEEFVTYKHIISLTFTDGLGLLKGVELRQTNGDYWFSDVLLIDLISACLLKTGQQLDINVLCNLFPASVTVFTVESFFSINKINTRTFQKNKRDFIDCYEVLSEIMKAAGCVLYQYAGKWVIDRWADRHEQVTREYTYDVNNDPAYIGNTYTTLDIGETEAIKEVESALRKSVLRAAIEDKITYRFETWPELIRNLDFDEGTINLLLSGSSQRTYSLDYFTGTGRTFYTRREIDTLGNETQRYMYIEGAADWSDTNKFVRSNLSFPAIKGDKIELSFSAASQIDVSSTQPARARVMVRCGSYFLYGDGVWRTSHPLFQPYSYVEFEAAEDSTQWKSENVESDELPISGNVDITFFLMERCGSGNKTYYKDVDIKYIQAVNNSFSADGDINVYNNDVGKNPVEATVKISDALKKILKGALLQNDGDLESGWKRGGITETIRFTQLNALGYLQSNYRAKQRFEGTYRGGVDVVGFKPQYTIADVPNKVFALVSLDSVDFMRGTWNGTLLEVNDSVLDVNISTIGDDYVYNFVFL